ncbi:C-glycoside deglycosidase beta subunit domain-containing protein [Cryptosporangium japonicum]|uniref:C-deglycosylation enzyme beta subunit n=1 Tax=Cryptosporangium japonicum TaxID=80872 RepID=A0ABN0UF55_9ACTN
MFDQYIVCEGSLRGRPDGRPGGVVEVRMPYYRGLRLSMVEAVDLTLDGRPVPPARATFTVHGATYTFAEMPRVVDDRWEFGERATLTFETDEPLRPGEHEVAVSVRLRLSYMPVPGGGRDAKYLMLRGS